MAPDVSLKDLLQELAENRGFDFRGYKRTTLERRFRKRMFQLNIGSYAEYSKYIRQKPDELNQLLNTILINVTEFLRDQPAWEVLRSEVLPPMLKQLKPGAAFRVWSAGCASGEEAYSVAIILAEFFGARLSEFDIKIYATDIDEESLAIARRGEYAADALRHIRASWREKYFGGRGPLRINREIRRMVIFGRSNLIHDAPISHVNLLVCRNLLIYFDSDSQKQILTRLHYALDPGGILFLGKSESQLANSPLFRRVNSRWRIFQRLVPAALGERPESELQSTEDDHDAAEMLQIRRELDATQSRNRFLLESLRVGVLVLSSDGTIEHNNNAILTLYGLPPSNLLGRRVQDTDLFNRSPELMQHLQGTGPKNESARFQAHVRVGTEDRLLEINIRPIFNDRGERSGTVIYCDDVTFEERLQTTVEELQSTSEELQSANEELETTNEELQSANEELETTNEELQSTNEELETTNEELQSLNEELETTNQELEERTKELDQVNNVYAQTLEKVRVPVMLVNEEGRINFWNTMAIRLFGFKNKPPIELSLEQLPFSEDVRNLLVRRHRTVLIKQAPVVAKNQFLGGKYNGSADIHFSVISTEDKELSVLILFEPSGPESIDGNKLPKRSPASKGK
ncbi:MAG: chemotaxis protein CheR [Acidobacteria bacterium]|nr:MAG: chemotaxis protein CheR [Acidobacteriota bacterium]